MELKTTKRQVLREVPYGMLVWQCEDGRFIVNEDGDFMHVFIQDFRNQSVLKAAKDALSREAANFGEERGKPIFWTGRRPIDDEQLEYQLQRAAAGLIPDPLDIAAIREEEQALSNGN